MNEPHLFTGPVARQLIDKLNPDQTPGQLIQPGRQLMTAIMTAAGAIPAASSSTAYGSGQAQILKRSSSGVSYVSAGGSPVEVINPFQAAIADTTLFSARREQMSNKWVVQRCGDCAVCCISRIELDWGVVTPTPRLPSGTLAWDVTSPPIYSVYTGTIAGVPSRICRYRYVAPVLTQCGFNYNQRVLVYERDIPATYTFRVCLPGPQLEDFVYAFWGDERWRVYYFLRDLEFVVETSGNLARYYITSTGKYAYIKYPKPGSTDRLYTIPRGVYGPPCGTYVDRTFTLDREWPCDAAATDVPCPDRTSPPLVESGSYTAFGVAGEIDWVSGCTGLPSATQLYSDIFSTYNSNPSFSSGGRTCNLPLVYTGYSDATPGSICFDTCESVRGWSGFTRDTYDVWFARSTVRLIC